MTYHTGTTLVQTIYTSKHFINLHHISVTTRPDTQPLLYHLLLPYIHALRLCFHLVWNELAKGNLVDGEDWWSDTFGLWEAGREWETPKLGAAAQVAHHKRKQDEEAGLDVGFDADDWMLEDVLDRMEEGLLWLSDAHSRWCHTLAVAYD